MASIAASAPAMSAKQRHSVAVEEVTIHAEGATMKTLVDKAETFIKCLGIPVVSAHGKFDAGQALGPRRRDGRLHEFGANAAMAGVGDEADAQDSNMCPCLAKRWQDIAPAKHCTVAQGDDLAKLVLDDVSKKSEGMLDGGSLCEGEVPLFAGDSVKGLVKAMEVGLCGWDDGDVHGARWDVNERLF